jgi:hypothetical protein
MVSSVLDRGRDGFFSWGTGTREVFLRVLLLNHGTARGRHSRRRGRRGRLPGARLTHRHSVSGRHAACSVYARDGASSMRFETRTSHASVQGPSTHTQVPASNHPASNAQTDGGHMSERTPPRSTQSKTYICTSKSTKVVQSRVESYTDTHTRRVHAKHRISIYSPLLQIRLDHALSQHTNLHISLRARPPPLAPRAPLPPIPHHPRQSCPSPFAPRPCIHAAAAPAA